MTPNEKAVQLYRYYIDYTQGHYNCKQCCLIAVDEILNYQSKLLKNYKFKIENSFYEQVKREIENL